MSEPKTENEKKIYETLWKESITDSPYTKMALATLENFRNKEKTESWEEFEPLFRFFFL